MLQNVQNPLFKQVLCGHLALVHSEGLPFTIYFQCVK